MAEPTLAARLRDGSTVYCGWSGLADPLASEALARGGFDAVCLDLQHGFLDFRALRDAVTAVAGAGAAPIVRVPPSALADIARALDIGAEAIICPMVNTRADAERFAAAVKFPPIGQRSWGPHRVMMLFGKEADAYLAEANSVTTALAMIETQEALDNLDDILKVPGIDGVFVGPNDLSISLSQGARRDHLADDIWPALETIAGRAGVHGKFAGIYANTPDLAGRYEAMGYRMIASGTDLAMLRMGATTLVKALRTRD